MARRTGGAQVRLSTLAHVRPNSCRSHPGVTINAVAVVYLHFGASDSFPMHPCCTTLWYSIRFTVLQSKRAEIQLPNMKIRMNTSFCHILPLKHNTLKILLPHELQESRVTIPPVGCYSSHCIRLVWRLTVQFALARSDRPLGSSPCPCACRSHSRCARSSLNTGMAAIRALTACLSSCNFFFVSLGCSASGWALRFL